MPNWGKKLGEPRQGVMLHYDDSGSDAGGVAWLTHDPRCHVSYNYLVMDRGDVVEIAPPSCRAWHAGVCRPSDPRLQYKDANSAFYGVAIAAKAGDQVTVQQLGAVVTLCRQLAHVHGWDLAREPWRLTGHNLEAWPRGRKIDPAGPDPAHPVLDLAHVRQLAAAAPALSPAA